MMNRNSSEFMAITNLLVLTTVGLLHAQPSSLLQPLDDTGGSARAAAMGSAFVAVADDSSALLWNPAGLGKLQTGQLALHHNSWLVDTLQESFTVGIPMGDAGGIGVMATFLDYGTFQGRDPNGAITPNYNANKWGFMLGWGKEWAPGFSAGLALRGGFQSALGNSYSLWSGDVGFLYSPDPQLRFGAALVNFGGNQSGGWVASAIRAGVSYKPEWKGPHGLLFSLDGTVEPQGVNRVGLGVEYSFQSKYFLRAGYQVYEQNNEIQGLQGLTAGAGIQWNGFELDYAFLPYGDLGTSHRVSLSYMFPSSKANSQPAVGSSTASPSLSGPPITFKPEPGSGTNKNTLTLQFDIPPDFVAQGQTLEAQGHRVEAMRLYQEAIIKDSQDLMAWEALGMSYYQLGQKVYAIQCFEQVLKLRPEDKAFSSWFEKYKASTP